MVGRKENILNYGVNIVVKKRRKQYSVGISKYYFPKELWPNSITSYMEVITVLANNRTEAANIVWDNYSSLWLKSMNPLSKGKRVSLDVNEPENNITIGRLQPICVHTHLR